ncbi:phosphate ABC transporter permease subunit PstC [Salinarchaeum laminariae]|uniref:phosphate ABC transporter permease subunit PstC n=1 Tax=Salinarchaeum laminariae TaxID=869888 RepID=UPI0020C1316B|nr:phosphate ABC transporter permease subunit PstC [Salinarchaeum laminariae]
MTDLQYRIRDYRQRTAPGAIAIHVLGAALFVAAAGLFWRGSGLFGVPLLGMVGLTAVGWRTHQGETARGLTLLAAALTVSVMLLIVGYLLVHARDAFEHMGVELLWMLEGPFWEPPSPEGNYSLTPLLVGTALTTVIATMVAAPIGIAGAVFLSEMAPERVRVVVKPGVELLAGIPSITYGFVGLVLVNQYFYAQFQTPTIASYFAAGLMIGLMSLPTVVSVAEDALSAVPESMKSGSLAMGSTEWQTTKSVTIPAAFSGVSAAVMLGVGRAMGETMAATVMLSHSKGIPVPFFDVFSRYGETLTTVIAQEAPNATGGMHESALFAAGVVLFVSVMSLSIGAQYVEWRMYRKLGGES